MDIAYIGVILALSLFLGMLLFFELGRFIGKRKRAKNTEAEEAGIGSAEAAVFGLLGLLLAFTFSGAAERFEERRHLVTEEANIIGTAFLRVDLLPSSEQPAMRELFRQYLQVRIDTYHHANSEESIAQKLQEGSVLQDQIWTLAIATLPQDKDGNVSKILLPALNEMFDIVTTRIGATNNHPPKIIFVLLVGLSWISALLVGYVMSSAKHRNWIPVWVLAFTLSLTFYVILDLEYPRQGLIRVDASDHLLIELLDTMK